MNQFEKELNEVLVDTFGLIIKAEELAIKKTGRINLSISEMHLVEAVGKQKGGRTVSAIAEDLGVTLPSVTIAINRLCKKGYVEKSKSGDDGRVVIVSLTRSGHKIDLVHKFFHRQMLNNLSCGMTPEEKSVLLKGITRLNRFFREKTAGMEAK
ncbi:MAG: MarR family transcriptional regulator [Bacillota bacterium]|nr:MarR family transcriptional regulator [Bacillota bacterium]